MDKEQVNKIKEVLDKLYEIAESVPTDVGGWKLFNKNKTDKRRFSVQKYKWKDDNFTKYCLKYADFSKINWFKENNHIKIDIDIHISEDNEIAYLSIKNEEDYNIEIFILNVYGLVDKVEEDKKKFFNTLLTIGTGI